MRVIGVTGSLATGKSTVAGLMARLGAETVDADAIARALIRRGGQCFKPVVNAFGKEILTGGRIDRKKLASRVFQDKRQRKRLERIIHPMVRKEIRQRIKKWHSKKNNTIAVIDVPLLFESKMQNLVDLTVVVKSTRARQLSRATKKSGMTKAEAMRRIKAQMPLRKKIRMADIIIDNNGNLTTLKSKVKQIWEKL